MPRKTVDPDKLVIRAERPFTSEEVAQIRREIRKRKSDPRYIPIMPQLPPTAYMEELMDKYAVPDTKPSDKTASDDNSCPSCGNERDKKSNPPHCDNCGTKPVEEEADRALSEKE